MGTKAKLNGTILALDPGTYETGWVIMAPDKTIKDMGISKNEDMLAEIRNEEDCERKKFDVVVCEVIEPRGMPIGISTIDTCLWIGRIWEAAYRSGIKFVSVYRREIKLAICGSARAKDANIRQALLDKLGPQGTKKNPGPTYGVKSHIWSAVAIGVYYIENLLNQKENNLD